MNFYHSTMIIYIDIWFYDKYYGNTNNMKFLTQKQSVFLIKYIRTKLESHFCLSMPNIFCIQPCFLLLQRISKESSSRSHILKIQSIFLVVIYVSLNNDDIIVFFQCQRKRFPNTFIYGLNKHSLIIRSWIGLN